MSGLSRANGLTVYIYGAGSGAVPPIIQACVEMIARQHAVVDSPDTADIAVAPLLTTMLTTEEINAPRAGTLVFHPSLLPRHRGADAIKWAFSMGETYTGVSWFWPDSGIDTGDICEQEVVAIFPGEPPRAFYERAVIPAAVRTLTRALDGIASGAPRRVPQQLEHGTYEPRIKRRDQ